MRDQLPGLVVRSVRGVTLVAMCTLVKGSDSLRALRVLKGVLLDHGHLLCGDGPCVVHRIDDLVGAGKQRIVKVPLSHVLSSGPPTGAHWLAGAAHL